MGQEIFRRGDGSQKVAFTPPPHFFPLAPLILSAPSKHAKPICRDFGSMCLQIGSKEFDKKGQKGDFLVHSAISKPKIDGFGARPS